MIVRKVLIVVTLLDELRCGFASAAGMVSWCLGWLTDHSLTHSILGTFSVVRFILPSESVGSHTSSDEDQQSKRRWSLGSAPSTSVIATLRYPALRCGRIESKDGDRSPGASSWAATRDDGMNERTNPSPQRPFLETLEGALHPPLGAITHTLIGRATSATLVCFWCCPQPAAASDRSDVGSP